MGKNIKYIIKTCLLLVVISGASAAESTDLTSSDRMRSLLCESEQAVRKQELEVRGILNKILKPHLSHRITTGYFELFYPKWYEDIIEKTMRFIGGEDFGGEYLPPEVRTLKNPRFCFEIWQKRPLRVVKLLGRPAKVEDSKGYGDGLVFEAGLKTNTKVFLNIRTNSMGVCGVLLIQRGSVDLFDTTIDNPVASLVVQIDGGLLEDNQEALAARIECMNERTVLTVLNCSGVLINGRTAKCNLIMQYICDKEKVLQKQVNYKLYPAFGPIDYLEKEFVPFKKQPDSALCFYNLKKDRYIFFKLDPNSPDSIENAKCIVGLRADNPLRRIAPHIFIQAEKFLESVQQVQDGQSPAVSDLPQSSDSEGI
jgi:hypothetical protein